MQDLLQYINKEITVSYREGEDLATITGKVEKANLMCMLVRPKGKPYTLIDAADVASVHVLPEPVPAIKVRGMDKIPADNIRQHLADRHGVPLEQIPDDVKDAIAMHEEMHTRNLGHHHPPTVAQVAERAAALEAVASGDEEENVAIGLAAAVHLLGGDVEDEGEEACEHPGIECEGLEDCNCQCVDCTGIEG